MVAWPRVVEEGVFCAFVDVDLILDAGIREGVAHGQHGVDGDAAVVLAVDAEYGRVYAGGFFRSEGRAVEGDGRA